MKKPVIFLKTKKNFYLYEAYNNDVYKISNLAYNVLPLLLNGKSAATIKNRFNRQFGTKKINNFLNKGSKKGIFGYLQKDLPHIKFLNPLRDKKNLKKFDENLHHLTLNVTDNCNLRCKYCILSSLYPTEKDYSTASMNWDTARMAVNFLKSHSAKSKDIAISFYGGEPLLQFELIKRVVSYAKRVFKDKNLRFNMTNNGTLLDREKCTFLIKNNFRLLISFDGPKDIQDRYRVYRDGRGSFDTVIKNINGLKSMDEKYFRENARFNIVLAPPYRFEDIEKFFIKDLSLNPDQVRVSFVKKINTRFYERFPETENDHCAQRRLRFQFAENRKKHTGFPAEFYPSALFHEIFLRIFKYRHIDIYKTTRFPTAQCLPGVKKLYVETNGDFHICDKVDHTYPIGNVYEGFDMERIHRLFDDYYSDAAEACAECWAMRFCSLCIIHVFKNGKFNKENKSNFCQYQKKLLKKVLRDYCSILEENPEAFDYMDKIKII